MFNPVVKKKKSKPPHQPDCLPVFTLQPAEQSPTSRVESECVCARESVYPSKSTCCEQRRLSLRNRCLSPCVREQVRAWAPTSPASLGRQLWGGAVCVYPSECVCVTHLLHLCYFGSPASALMSYRWLTPERKQCHGSGKRINEAAHGNNSCGKCCCCHAHWIGKSRKNRYISDEGKNATTGITAVQASLETRSPFWVLIYILCKY